MSKIRRDFLRMVVLTCLACGVVCVLWAQPRVPGPADFTIVEPIAGSDLPLQLTFIQTIDGIHTPVSMRKPKGEGPFPAVLFLEGNGGGGMQRARGVMLHSGYTPEVFLKAGYVVAWLRYRAEVPWAYPKAGKLVPKGNIMPRAPLDYDDLISTVGYFKKLPYVDPKRVALVGSSHGGELILKAVTEIDVAAGVCSEPATAEYLGFAGSEPPEGNAPPKNKPEAMERIRKINTPLLVMGRDSDHNQKMFRLTYDWLKEAGRQVEWVSHDHPRHGFIYVRRDQSGAYNPDPIQRTAIDHMAAFLAKHLGK